MFNILFEFVDNLLIKSHACELSKNTYEGTGACPSFCLHFSDKKLYARFYPPAINFSMHFLSWLHIKSSISQLSLSCL